MPNKSGPLTLTRAPARWRDILAGWLSPRIARDADRYHYLRAQIDRANQQLGAVSRDARETTQWLLNEDTDHWRAADSPSLWRLHSDLAEFRETLREHREFEEKKAAELGTKIGQLYQVLFHVLAGGPGVADLIDRRRALGYAGDATFCDPDFLPWPRNAPRTPARDADWEWWWSHDEENYRGPHASRDDAIADARDSGEEGSIHVMEARKGAIRLASYFDLHGIESYIENLEEGALTDYQGEDGELLTDGISSAQWAALAARLQPVVAAWQDDNEIVITPWRFADTRNGEWVEIAAADRAAQTPETPHG